MSTLSENTPTNSPHPDNLHDHVHGDTSDSIPALIVRAGTTWLAIEVNLIVEITDMPVVTKLPRVPAHIPGMMNHRGLAVPLLDLRRFLKLPEGLLAGSHSGGGHIGISGGGHIGGSASDSSSSGGMARIVIVFAESMRVGLLCDAARSIVELPVRDLCDLDVLQGDQLRAFSRKEIDLPIGRVALLDLPLLLQSARVKA